MDLRSIDGWLIDWLIDWLVDKASQDWLIDWLIRHQKIDRLADWSIDWEGTRRHCNCLDWGKESWKGTKLILCEKRFVRQRTWHYWLCIRIPLYSRFCGIAFHISTIYMSVIIPYRARTIIYANSHVTLHCTRLWRGRGINSRMT